MVCERPPADFLLMLRPIGLALRCGSPPVSGGECIVDFARVNSPPHRGGEPRSGRGSLTHHHEIDFLGKADHRVAGGVVIVMSRSSRSDPAKSKSKYAS